MIDKNFPPIFETPLSFGQEEPINPIPEENKEHLLSRKNFTYEEIDKFLCDNLKY